MKKKEYNTTGEVRVNQDSGFSTCIKIIIIYVIIKYLDELFPLLKMT